MSVGYSDDSYALHTDLYQINMVESYWADGIHNRRAVFDLFFRKLPFGNGYGVFAGLERIVEYVQNFSFSDSDLNYLHDKLGYGADFLNYLSSLRFTGNIRAMREGELVFGGEPFVVVDAPLAEAQLLETALLNIVNYQTLIATKASRMKQAIGNQTALEFGARRAHEFDAALWGARAAYIGGFDATSDVRVGKRFGIPVAGTHAHSFVQAYGDDYTAFRKYAERHKDCIFLVDTFDTLQSGVPSAIRAAREMGSNNRFVGIRLDSGDLAYLSKEARRMLDEAGFPDVIIVASGDIDEHTVLHLRDQGARIDAWGIGTKLITAYDDAALGAVYKLSAIENERGEMVDTIKISSNPEKVTTPGIKNVHRIINHNNNRSEGDYITLQDERIDETRELFMFHPVHTYLSKTVVRYEARPLLHDIFRAGQFSYELPEIQAIRQYATDNLTLLWDSYKRTLNPGAYPVDLSKACWDNKMRVLRQAREHVTGQLE
jgi:nicotinate phosphoribosyltransferase